MTENIGVTDSYLLPRKLGYQAWFVHSGKDSEGNKQGAIQAAHCLAGDPSSADNYFVVAPHSLEEGT